MVIGTESGELTECPLTTFVLGYRLESDKTRKLAQIGQVFVFETSTQVGRKLAPKNIIKNFCVTCVEVP